MVTNTEQNDSPLAIETTNKTKNDVLCLCKVLSPVFQISRLLGLFPVIWKHKNNKCVFTKSLFWLIYTLILTYLYTYHVVSTVDFPNMLKKKSLPILLNDITNAIYGIFVVLLILTNIFRYPTWIRTLNKFLILMKTDLLCEPARKTVMNTQYGFIATLTFIFVVQISVLFWLHSSADYSTNFQFSIFGSRIMQNIPFAFYMLSFTAISMLIGTLACFEKLTISTLQYIPVHPMKEIDETNNQRDFLGVFHYKLCTGEHPCSSKMAKMSQPERVEYLRILHENISLCIYSFNSCMNPQFLIHAVVELIVLIIHWYAVIAYIAYNFKAPLARTIHILNCVFVVLHTIGLFLFLKNAQHLKNMIQGLTNFLLEYSTRISSQDEHQQVRIFIEKLKNHRPLTASGVFTIDLGIAGPVSKICCYNEPYNVNIACYIMLFSTHLRVESPHHAFLLSVLIIEFHFPP
ncbi:hypothetical protein NQ317_019310 [Molorchus minor]|uniref:Gustatory receptor n=1 Tax=Molorchus minor TaxID=1323400 RepID=A0ABQ9ITC5_9CUCU|nr:hypothetical protein NQ317_019310 [Molorchus minor]